MKKFIIFVTFLVYATHELEALTCEQIRAFIDGHNELRLRLAKGEVSGQPAASDMTYMVWDNELQEKAERWAAMFLKSHNPDKTLPSGKFPVGENLYWFTTTDRDYKLDPKTALHTWWSEHKDFMYGPLQQSDFDGSRRNQVGHYTQMAWANTMFVGCAIADATATDSKEFFVVCNYGPAGNYLGETPYKKGRDNHNLMCNCQKYDEKCDCDKLYGNNC